MLREVFVAISGMLHNGRHIFSDEDDEWLVNIVDTMIDKELLPHQEIADWISCLAQCCNLSRSRSQVIARVNSKNFYAVSISEGYKIAEEMSLILPCLVLRQN